MLRAVQLHPRRQENVRAHVARSDAGVIAAQAAPVCRTAADFLSQLFLRHRQRRQTRFVAQAAGRDFPYPVIHRVAVGVNENNLPVGCHGHNGYKAGVLDLGKGDLLAVGQANIVLAYVVPVALIKMPAGANLPALADGVRFGS